jgi:hypothetical protein
MELAWSLPYRFKDLNYDKREFIKSQNNARDAIRTHEPLQEWILSPSELAGLSYPRIYGSSEMAVWICVCPTAFPGSGNPEALNYLRFN